MYCHVYVFSVTNNNGFWIWCFGLLALLYNYTRILQLTNNDCLRLAPFLPGSRALSLPLWRMTNKEFLLTPCTALNDVCLSNQSWSQSQSYVTTDGQSASLSWNKAPIWGLRQDLHYCMAVAGCWCGALALTRGRICRLAESQSTVRFICY
jgi:hypothetical protein